MTPIYEIGASADDLKPSTGTRNSMLGATLEDVFGNIVLSAR